MTKECPKCDKELIITMTYRNGEMVYHLTCSCGYEDYITEE